MLETSNLENVYLTSFHKDILACTLLSLGSSQKRLQDNGFYAGEFIFRNDPTKKNKSGN